MLLITGILAFQVRDHQDIFSVWNEFSLELQMHHEKEGVWTQYEHLLAYENPYISMSTSQRVSDLFTMFNFRIANILKTYKVNHQEMAFMDKFVRVGVAVRFHHSVEDENKCRTAIYPVRT